LPEAYIARRSGRTEVNFAQLWLAKVSLFLRLLRAYLCIPFNTRRLTKMTTFWKSLAQVAQGQLFSGGHLSPSLVAQMAAKPASEAGDGKPRSARCDHPAWPRLAIPH
jgi:hypothetical protein